MKSKRRFATQTADRKTPRFSNVTRCGMQGKYLKMIASKHSLLILIVALTLAASLAAQGTPGTYKLSFQDINGNPVSTLPVCTPAICEELILKAHIEDSSQHPAQRRIVIFQYCSFKGFLPTI